MFKNFFICIALICNLGFLSSAEIYSLKKNYEKTVPIAGTDQNSIKKGMQSGLSSLLVNLTGNSKILNKISISRMMSTPETFISEYKLASDEGTIVASFIYEGDLIREYLSQNELPLWLSDIPIILTFLPCIEIDKSIENTDELDRCTHLWKNLETLSISRNAKITKPLMDLTDISYYESLGSIYPEFFMDKISRRYDIDSWLLCFTRNEFGLLLEEPQCLSSVDQDPSSAPEIFNNLLDKINLRRSLVVNKDIQNKTKIRFEGIDSYSLLESTLHDLSSQVLIYDVTVLEIEGENIEISLSHYGTEADLLSLLSVHENYKKLNTLSQDIISFKFTKS